MLFADVGRSNIGAKCTGRTLTSLTKRLSVPVVTSKKTNAVRRFQSTFALNGTSTTLTTDIFRFKRVGVPSLGSCLYDRKVAMEERG